MTDSIDNMGPGGSWQGFANSSSPMSPQLRQALLARPLDEMAGWGRLPSKVTTRLQGLHARLASSDAALYVRKPSSVSCRFDIASKDGGYQVLFDCLKGLVLQQLLATDRYDAVLLGQVAFVEHREALGLDVKVMLDVEVIHQGLQQAVDLHPFVFAVGIRQEGDEGRAPQARGEVEQAAVWVSPDGVKFSLEEYTGQLPQGPAQHPLPATLHDLFFDDGEALAFRLAKQWLMRHGKGLLMAGDLAAEGEERGAVERRGIEHVGPLAG